jgi:hypothetical protein
VSRRHAQYYEAFAAAADQGLRGPDEVSWTERIDRDLDNLRAAVSWAVDAGEVGIALEIIASLATGFGTRIGAPFGPIAERAAAMPEALGHPLRCVALASAARSARDRGEGERARLLAQSALQAVATLSPGPASAHARCRALSGVTSTIYSLEDLSRLRGIAEQRLAAATELDDPWERAHALIQIAAELRDQDPTRALGYAEEGLRLARELGNPNALTYTTMLLGTVIAHSDPGRAQTLLEEAIGMASTLGNNFAEINARHMLGLARTLDGDHREAAYAYLGSAELANRAGDRLAVLSAVGGVAGNLAELGEHEPALVLATWAEMRGEWPADWASHPPFGTSPALPRLQSETIAAQRQRFEDQAHRLNDAEAIALARSSLEALV